MYFLEKFQNESGGVSLRYITAAGCFKNISKMQ